MRETISLDGIKSSIIAIWKQSFIIIVGCAVVSLLLAFILPPQYESSALMQVKPSKSGLGGGLAGGDILGLIGMGSQTSPKEYIEIIQSRSVLQPVIDKLDDLTPEEKKEMTAEKFYKKYLSLNNPKSTNMIQLTVTAKSPEQAQFIAAEISNNLKHVLTTTGQSDNSYLKNFFESRLKQAQKDMEISEQKMLDFSQTTKVFSPDEQANGLVTAYMEVEKKKAESIVNLDVSQAKLSEVNQQLAKQNIALNRFNMTDNPSMEDLRQHITAKEMEILTLKQTFTEKHPNVILARQQLAAFKAKITEEVSKAVDSQTMTLNPLQGELIKQQALTEAEVSAYKAEQEALGQISGKLDKEILKFSASTYDFVSLKRQATINQEVYLGLRKQYEQFKIQEAKDSLDITIIDSADLPYKPSFPKKILFLAAGLVLGFLWASGKVIYQLFK